MAFDYTNARTMTRALSVLLADATDTEVQDALEQHAVPRIRMHLLAATDGNGQSIFYSVLSQMTDPTHAATTEAMVDALVDAGVIRDALRRVAAALACAALIASKFSIIDPQFKQANRFEDQAMADLERLCKSQLMQKAVEQAASTANLITDVTATVYFATDVDIATIDIDESTAEAYAGAELPYVGAAEAGKVVGTINGVSFETSIAAGDKPITIAQKLVAAFEALPAPDKPNVALAPSEIIAIQDSRIVPYTDVLTGNPTTGIFKYTRQMAKVSILPRNYDNVLDVAVMTVSLVSRDENNPTQFIAGTKGIIYGTTNTSIGLTNYGPHSIAIDLHTGKATALNEENTSSSRSSPVSDSLFFLTVAPTLFDGTLKYRISGSDVQTIQVPAGTDAQILCELIAKDLADKAAQQRVLGAVRPSSLITINGTPTSAPGLELVAFGVENQMSKIVLQVLSVPGGVVYGVVPQTLISQANFDDKSKSVVITTVISKLQGQGSQSTADSKPTADVKLVKHIPTPGLQNILDKFKNWR